MQLITSFSFSLLEFRSRSRVVLIATDVAARGLGMLLERFLSSLRLHFRRLKHSFCIYFELVRRFYFSLFLLQVRLRPQGVPAL